MSDAANNVNAATAPAQTTDAANNTAPRRGRGRGRGGRGPRAPRDPAAAPAGAAQTAPAKQQVAPEGAAQTTPAAAGEQQKKKRRPRKPRAPKTADAAAPEGAAQTAAAVAPAGAAQTAPAAAAATPAAKKELTPEQLAKRQERNKKRKEKRKEIAQKKSVEKQEKQKQLLEEIKEADSKPPVFSDVKDLQPGTDRVNLLVKVVSAQPNIVVEKERQAPKRLQEKLQAAGKEPRPARQIKVAEVVIGDATGTVVFSARNDQIEQVQTGATLIVRNAMVKLFQQNMRVAVGKYGKILPYTAAESNGKSDKFTVLATEDANVSNKKFKVVYE